MATIDTSGISPGQIIRSAQLLNVINALDGTNPVDIIITGSLSVSGSTSLSGSTFLKGIPNTSRAHVITYDSITGQLSYLNSASLGVTTSVSIPGGTNTQIQYNSGSVLAATSSFTFNYTLQSLQQGNNVSASSTFAHAQGNQTTASGQYSHAEGERTNAKEIGSHAEGISTIASGSYSHAEGNNTQAIGNSSHAEGLETIALGNYQHVQGQYNLSSSAESAFIIGNGTSNSNRSNLVFASGSQFQITGSLRVSGSITGSLFGTSSFADSASFAASASWAPNGSPISVTGTTLYSTSPAAGPNFNITESIFFGTGSGYQATGAKNSNFLGTNAGQSATSAQFSNFIGSNAGKSATNADNSNFIGNFAGASATKSSYSNFLGNLAGFAAISASYSTLMGFQVGYNTGFVNSIGSNNIIIGTNITLPKDTKDSINLGGIIFATGSHSNIASLPFSGSVTGSRVGIGTSTPEYTLDVSGSLRVTNGITGSLFGTSSWAVSASWAPNASPIAVIGSTLYSTSPAASSANTTGSIFLGSQAGNGATNASDSNFLGNLAGSNTLNTGNSNFLGLEAGRYATLAFGSNFFGIQVGYDATSASYSNFLGVNAGQSATNANNSNFLGEQAGYRAASASYSTLIGYRVGLENTTTASNSIGPNNIIIGTNITLPAQQRDSINLGGIIFATGSYFDAGFGIGTPFSGSMPNARVGIGTSTPQFTLDVSGSGRFTNTLIASSSVVLPGSSSIFFGDSTLASTSSYGIFRDSSNRLAIGNTIGTNGYGANGIMINTEGKIQFNRISQAYNLYDTTLNIIGSGSNDGITMTQYNDTNNRYRITIESGSQFKMNFRNSLHPNSGSFNFSGSLNVAGPSTLRGTVNITPITSTTSSLVVTGPTLLSGSQNTISGSVLTVVGSGSAQPIFTVQGSQGELFSVTDSLSGSLFSVNDISGLPIVEVFSDGTTLMGNYLDPMLVTTARNVLTNSGSFTIYSLPTASYDTAFFDYSVRSGSNARAGQIMAIQSGSSVNFTEVTSSAFGSTTGISLGVFVSGSNMVLTGSAATTAWTIKTIIRSI